MNKLLCPTCGIHVDQHPKGRCMDYWVAEAVFGKTRAYYHCPHFDKKGRMLSFCSCPSCDSYSRSIAAAWEVVEKIQLTDRSWATTVYWDDGDDIPENAGWVTCYAYYGETEDDFRAIYSIASTAPLAICQAAIKACAGD